MPNGKGTLDCSYCSHFRGDIHEPAHCNFHDVPLPGSGLNRLCCNFSPTDEYHRDQSWPETMPPARRFTWFREDFEPGVLYQFMYNTPEVIECRTVLRVFDYDRGAWVRPDPAT